MKDNRDIENSNRMRNRIRIPFSATDRIQQKQNNQEQPVALFITSYPPRECGIATYSQDLLKALSNKFGRSFNISICALESETEKHQYPEVVTSILDTSLPGSFAAMSAMINEDHRVKMVVIQHEFGFFEKKEAAFRGFLKALSKPAIIVFHTVLPHPQENLKANVQEIARLAERIIVMTHSSEKILIEEYALAKEKIIVIPHGTHLVPHSDKELLKAKYGLTGRKVLSTFGLLSAGKSIETTLRALPEIVKMNPDVLFLIIGKTHPSVIKHEGERYRASLEAMVNELRLGDHVRFINQFLPLPELLEYLQLTDIYLFTSADPNQAVSGTFSYAISCGCPVISTPIPHAVEVLKNDGGIIIGFGDSAQLATAVLNLLNQPVLRENISFNGLQRMAPTAWENAAIAHALLFEHIGRREISLKYDIPDINLNHIKKLTTPFGMIQFSKSNQSDIDSGYTLDDNARALIAICEHYRSSGDENDIPLIKIYLDFIKYCQQSEGYFLNYVDADKRFTDQNSKVNLADSNGRAIWALGYLVSMEELLPKGLVKEAQSILHDALMTVKKLHSTRAMAFIIKGLYYRNIKCRNETDIELIRIFANRLLQMYRHEAESNWYWFESYLTYANSLIPEAMLCAWLATSEPEYRAVAVASFDFLLSKTFTAKNIKVVSNKTWLHKMKNAEPVIDGGEQPIDIAYTIIALGTFYEALGYPEYLHKMKLSFNWFLGANHLQQIIYNPCTGGCYDGLEENYVNINQGAESTVSYLIARLTVENSLRRNMEKRLDRELLQQSLASISMDDM